MASVFNRNVITKGDIENLLHPAIPGQRPKTLAANPPGGHVAAVLAPGAGPDAGRAAAAAGGAAAVKVPTEDDYITRLLKYVPMEVLGAYLFMAGVIDSNVTDKHDHAIWLAGLLAGVLLATIAYDIRVLNVVRPMQIAMSVIGLAVYVFSLGGWFATTTWYHQWYASIAVPVFALLVGIIKLKPLPVASS
jgi:hypothetical protein